MNSSFSHTGPPPVSRRGFLGTAALGASALAADMTVLEALRSPVLAEELPTPAEERHPALAGGRCQST